MTVGKALPTITDTEMKNWRAYVSRAVVHKV